MSESPIAGTQMVPEQSQTQAVASCARRGPSAKLLAAVVAILGGGVLLTALTADVTKMSELGVKLVDGRPFLIDKIGDWTGGELQGLTEAERQLLPADTEGARRLYRDKSGDQLFCSIVLAGRDVTSIHRPEFCLPGQGWNIQGEHVQTVPVAGVPGGSLGVMRMNALHSVSLTNGRTVQQRAVFVYWFIGKNRVTPYHWQRIFWTACDRVLHNTNHRWAYVLIYVPVVGDVTKDVSGESQGEAMKVVTRFVQDIYPTMIEK